MRLKQLTIILGGSLALAVIMPSASAAISSIANGNYTAGTTWSDGNPPTAGQDYIIQNGVEHAAAGTFSLAGDSVTINSGFLRLTGNAPQSTVKHATINNLTLNGGRLDFRSDNQYTRTMYLDSGLAVSSASEVRLGDGGEQFTMEVYLAGGLTGAGNLNFVSNVGNSTDDRGTLHMTVANSTFSGNWSTSSMDTGFGILSAEAANALGSGSITIGTRSILTAAAANALDSVPSVNLTTATSSLVLTYGWNNPSGSLSMDAGSTLDLADSISTIASLTIGGNSVDPGTYDASALAGLGYGGNFSGGFGTIEVVPEPASLVLLGIGAIGLCSRRRI